MKKYLYLAVASVTVFGLISCGGAATQSAEDPSTVAEGTEQAACDCEKGKAGETAWCESCNVGYVDGKKVACKGCVEAAQNGTECVHCTGKQAAHAECDCQKVASGTGWCEPCNVGFINGKKVACKGCVEAAQAGTSCPHCSGDQG